MVGTNPFSSLAQPNTIPVVSWPATFFIDNDLGGSPLTTQDGSLLTFKAMISTGRKWVFVGDGMQRANFVTYATEHDFSADATIVLQNYQNYINYFKPNVPLIFGASFQGNLLGSIGANGLLRDNPVYLPLQDRHVQAGLCEKSGRRHTEADVIV